MKRCAECKTHQPLDNFATNRSKTDGKSDKCKSCKKRYNEEYYKRTREIHNPGRRARSLQETERCIEFIRGILESNPCVDCGNDDIRVLEFDHLGDKKFNIAQGMRRGSLPSLKLEVAKCEVVCANCHRIRTLTRAGTSFRLTSVR